MGEHPLGEKLPLTLAKIRKARLKNVFSLRWVFATYPANNKSKQGPQMHSFQKSALRRRSSYFVASF